MTQRERELDELVQQVTQMRHWQKQYFKTRSSDALSLSKRHERRVDLLLESVCQAQQSFLPAANDLTCRALVDSGWSLGMFKHAQAQFTVFATAGFETDFHTLPEYCVVRGDQVVGLLAKLTEQVLAAAPSRGGRG